MKSTVICGTFDDNGGKRSGFMQKLFEGHVSIVNGGTLEQLEAIFNVITTPGCYDAIYWFPNVANSVPKYLPLIKQKNPKCILVCSKKKQGTKTRTLWNSKFCPYCKMSLMLAYTEDDPHFAPLKERL